MKKIFSIYTFTFFRLIEEKIWGNRINSNVCFASISILIATLAGALNTGSYIINDWFYTDLECSWYMTIMTLLFIMLFNIMESIFAAEDAKVATLRSLLVVGSMLLGTAVGAITSVVVAIILAIAATIFFFSLLFRALTGSLRGEKAQLESNDLIEFMTGSGKVSGNLSQDGQTFYADNGKTYERDSIVSDNWYEKEG
jgi:hypothetical protein